MKASENRKFIDFIDLKSQYLALRELIAARIQRVLEHGQCIMGSEVKGLEEWLAQYAGARHCITVASGTDGCHSATDDCPNSTAAAARVMSLPMSVDLSFQQQYMVCAALGCCDTPRLYRKSA